MLEEKLCINGCGKTVKNQGVHDRYCPNKPHVIKEQPKPKQEAKKAIVISDVQPLKQQDIYDTAQNVAWFLEGNNRFFRVPEFIGLFHGEDVVPTVLIMTNDGTLLPPFLVASFIGMFPQNTEWPEQQPKEPEQITEVETFKEPEPETQAEKANEFTVQQAIKPTEESKKKGLFSFLSKKKEAPDTSEIDSLLREASNAGKA